MTIIPTLDPEQRAAVTSAAPATLVMAGAGTGKTTTLASRIAWLVGERGIPARSITAVTFTNRAARELKDRVSKLAGPAAADVVAGTFHGLSARILRRNAEKAGFRDPAFTILDQQEAASVMAAACRELSVREMPEGIDEKSWKKERDREAKEFSQAVTRQVALWKGWGLTAAEATDPSRPRRSEEEERMAQAYAAYQYELESRNQADFGDLILKAVALFRADPDVLARESERVRHLLVDEAQDANPVQVEWARLLSSAHGEITAVGDEDQNIYGFQGGYPGAMREMAGPLAAETPLVRNRRCTEEILAPANLAVGYNRRPSPKILSSGRHGAAVTSTAHPATASEAAWTARKVADMIGAGTKPCEIALLFRLTASMAPFEEALARHGVRTEVASGSPLLEREEARDVAAMVRLAVNPHDEIAFRRLAARPPKGLGASATDAICDLATARSLPFNEACAAACASSTGAGLRRDAREGAYALSRALSFLSEGGRSFAPPSDLIETGIRETGYEEWISSGDRATAGGGMKTVNAIWRLADGCDSPVEFLDLLALSGSDDASPSGEAVRLSTIHSSKGLEFDHVFCPAFNEGVIPNGRALAEGSRGRPGDPWNGPRGGGIEEERRLVHVAFTRARHTLHVSFSWRSAASALHSKGGGGPSMFMAECELDWEDLSAAPTAALGMKAKSRKRAGRAGFAR